MAEQQQSEWIEWAGGECPVEPSAVVDLRFRGYDSFREPPYLRHHEMWEQEAATIGSGYWLHQGLPTDIIAYRVVSK